MEESRMKVKHGLLVALMALVAWPTVSAATPTDAPVTYAAATCDDYANQAEAQRAKDTRDPDGDGIYCESLRGPCAAPDPRAGGGGGDAPDKPDDRSYGGSFVKPRGVQRLVFDADKYPNIRMHFAPRAGEAGRFGWSSIGAVPTLAATGCLRTSAKPGFDRDEYPPAVRRGKGKGLERGRDPRGWKADVRYVTSSENRSHGSKLGAMLDDFCNGTRFRYVFK